VGDWCINAQNAEAIRPEVIRGPALIGENNRDAAGEGFGHDHAKGFVGSGVNENIDLVEKVLRIGATQELSALGQSADEISRE
jgi:hypothetical protein